MKKIYLFLLTLLAFSAVQASEPVGPAFLYDGIWYEPISETECQTQRAADLYFKEVDKYETQYPAWNNWQATEVLVGKALQLVSPDPNKTDGSVTGPNTFNNKTPGIIPDTVYDGDTPYVVVEIGDFSFVGGQRLCTSDLRLPSTLRRIGQGAFAFNTQGEMQSELPLCNLDSIGMGAFYGCTWFKKYKFENIGYIGRSAFQGLNHLSNLSPDGFTFVNVREFGPYSFYNCNLKAITFEGVTEKIGDYAFYNCSQTLAVTLSESLKSIGNYAFYDFKLVEELKVPDSVESIGDYAFYDCIKICPLTLGKGLRRIGAYAFWDAHYECSNVLELPGSLEYIGPWAFVFNRTADERGKDTDLTEIYIRTSNPPELGVDENGMCAFGDFDPTIHFWDADGFWEFPYFCLHVPQGSYAAYANHPYWGKFQCILDDLEPDFSGESISQFINYVFIVPGEDYNLNDLFGDQYIGCGDFKIYGKESSDIISLAGSMVHGEKIGQELVIGSYNKTDSVFNGSQWVPVTSDTLKFAAVVFVCPTLTLVYDDIEETASAAKTKAAAPAATEDVSTDLDHLISDYASYQHILAFNSYPKFQIIPAEGITIEAIDKGKLDEGYMFTESLTGLKDEQYVTEDDAEFVVPLNPIVENRVIKLTTSLPYTGTVSGTTEIITSDLSIRVVFDSIVIEGADDADLVRIYDINGRTVLQTTDKTIQFSTPGVYVVTVNDTAFKVRVP